MQQIFDESWLYYEKLKKIMNCGYKNVIFFNSFSYSFLDNNSQPIIH